MWVTRFGIQSTEREASVFVGLILDHSAFKHHPSTFPPPAKRGSHENVSCFTWIMKIWPDFWHTIDSTISPVQISSLDHLMTFWTSWCHWPALLIFMFGTLWQIPKSVPLDFPQKKWWHSGVREPACQLSRTSYDCDPCWWRSIGELI